MEKEIPMRKALVTLVTLVALAGSATAGTATTQVHAGSSPGGVCSACW
jgi:hypothetical protein